MRKRRVLSGILPLLLAGTATSNGSSIVVLPATPPSQTPSIIERGEPAASFVGATVIDGDGVADIDRVGPSVIAIGEDAIPGGKVATATKDADKRPAWMSQALPDVIRGGVHGGAFPAPAAPAPAEPVVQPAEPDAGEVAAGAPTPEANGMPVE